MVMPPMQPPFPPGDAPEFKRCSACLSEIPSQAEVCRACGTRLEGIQCGACRSFCPHGATLCRHCGSSLERFHSLDRSSRPGDRSDALAGLRTMVIEAELLPTLLLELSLNPQRVVVQPEKLTISSYSLFGLTARHEELPWEKVAGFSHRSGLFWDAIAIETRGQTAATISCLSKRNAGKLKRLLQSLER